MFIRYNSTTKAVLHRSTVPFTVLPTSEEADAELPDAECAGEIAQLRLNADLSGLEVDPAKVPPVIPEYVRLRQQAYPPIGDQLDALWSGEPEQTLMKQMIDAVKAKYPKS